MRRPAAGARVEVMEVSVRISRSVAAKRRRSAGFEPAHGGCDALARHRCPLVRPFARGLLREAINRLIESAAPAADLLGEMQQLQSGLVPQPQSFSVYE